MNSEFMENEGIIPALGAKGAAAGSLDIFPQTDGGAAEGKTTMRAQKIRRRIIKLSAVLVILLPTLLATVYYGLIAADQYAVEVRFAVRGVGAIGGGSDLLTMVTGIPSGGSTTADSYILMDFIHSRAILEKLGRKINLKQIYSGEKADFLSAFDPDEPIEEFVDYWKDMTTLSFDTSSQIVVIEFRAFTAQDAKTVASAVLELSEQLINELSARARTDAVSFAEKEVARMEKRLRANRQAVRAFREKEQVIDPSKTAESRLTLLAKLEGELGIERANLSSLGQFMNKDSPRIKVLASKIEALAAQVQAERAKLGRNISGRTSGGSLTGLLEDYQTLLMDQEFSEKAFISALSALETARIEAGRQQRYLATFVRPSLPEDALYPRRLLNIFVIFVLSIVLWAIGTLLVYAIRDHTT